MKNGFFHKVLAGALIGIGCVLPGVSGGVMAVSFGLYRPMLDAIMGIFHDTRQKLRFLLPLALGGGMGMLMGAKGLHTAIRLYEKPMLMLFIGFILGGVPALLKEADGGEPFRPRHLAAMFAGLTLALPLVLVSGNGASVERLSPLQALLAGLLEGVGTVVPGLSASMILIRLGWYQAYLGAMAVPQLGTLCLAALGFVLSALLCMRAVKWLFDHARGYTCYGVLGFLLLSVALCFPDLENAREWWSGLGMLVMGAVSAHWLGHIK